MESFFSDIAIYLFGVVVLFGLFFGIFRFFRQSKLVSFWLSVAFSLAFAFGLMITVGIAHLVLPEIPNRLWGGPAVFMLLPTGLLVALNLIAVPTLYFVDKRKSMSDSANVTRVPEFVLHSVSFVGGAVGAFFSQRYFRHKTQSRSFQIIFYVSVIVSLIIYYYAVRWALLAPSL